MIRFMALSLVLGLAAPVLSQPNFEPPQAVPISQADKAQIQDRQKELETLFAALPNTLAPDIKADVEIYVKAGQWMLRHGEYFAKDSVKQTLTVIEAGKKRAIAAKDGKAPWRDARGKPIARGYYSHVDGSVQPFTVTMPEGFPGTKKWRLDILLHGRDQTLTEVKMLNRCEVSKGGSKADYVVLEPYGRGNNAYRWAGETDVDESVGWFIQNYKPGTVDETQVVLRGFSMGGAGTWHIGLHHPFLFAVMGPGAGFTTTRGYIKNLPPKLPDYQEKCLHIYDAVDYTENAFNIPVVAYSGEIDPQKAAADNIEKALKATGLPVKFTHVVAPGLEHKQPPEWQAKLEIEYRKHLAEAGRFQQHVRFVTYTTAYAQFGHGEILSLDEHYKKAVIDSNWTKDSLTIKTTNIGSLHLNADKRKLPKEIEIDGQKLTMTSDEQAIVEKVDGKWKLANVATFWKTVRKGVTHERALQGPIDDAFRDHFTVIRASNTGAWHEATHKSIQTIQGKFEYLWDKYFRSKLPVATKADGVTGNVVLFGDPGSNPEIAKLLPRLPIQWSKDKLVVNGKEYDAKNHLPVLIYPYPDRHGQYLVINSGHSFKEADLKGTNALLYPRYGDWAVMKVSDPGKEPELVDAGLFNERWQFSK